MRNQLVYDLPTRAFHWIFAGLFVSAFLVAKTVDDESAIFSYHMLAGLLLGATVLLRLVWGFVGSQNARFSSFALRPQELVDYFKGIFSGDKKKWGGHNPASSWATLLMFVFALGLGVTGYLMASGDKEAFEDIHELLANGFLVVVLMHVAGVVLHGFRHQDGLAFSMIDGNKVGVPAVSTIARSHAVVGAIFVILVVVMGGHLLRNFDQNARALSLFGSTLSLGENEEAEETGEGTERANDKDDDDDHDDD